MIVTVSVEGKKRLYVSEPPSNLEVSTTPAIELALNWLAHSNVRHATGNALALGGVNQGYNWKERRYPFIYSEITGYAISMFINAYRWTNDENYLDYARQSADFLLRLQAHAIEDGCAGAIPHGLTLPELTVRRQYHSFDVAMCLQGIHDLYTLDRTPELAHAAQAMSDWLIVRTQQSNGSFLSMYDAETGESKHLTADFFSDGGCLHAKHAIGLLKMEQVIGNGVYATAARRVCDWVLGLQDADGAFRATERDRQVVSHPHCYATEGLLYAHFILKDDRYGQAAQRAGEWLLKVQSSDGAICIAYKREWHRMLRRLPEWFAPLKVSDATAQAIRIWLILEALTGDQKFLVAAERAGNFLLRLQCIVGIDPNKQGGFYFAPAHPMQYTWSTMFATHALYALTRLKRTERYPRLLNELF